MKIPDNCCKRSKSLEKIEDFKKKLHIKKHQLSEAQSEIQHLKQQVINMDNNCSIYNENHIRHSLSNRANFVPFWELPSAHCCGTLRDTQKS